MGKVIDGIILTPLKVIPVEGGDVMHALKNTDEGFDGFGEVYFSNIHLNVIKGWKKHRVMQLNLIVPLGAVRFVIYDDRVGSTTYGIFNDITLARKSNYQRLTIPPGVWVAFQGQELASSILMNAANIVHDPKESDVKNLNEIEYKWEIV